MQTIMLLVENMSEKLTDKVADKLTYGEKVFIT